jgi:hypothetical protein
MTAGQSYIGRFLRQEEAKSTISRTIAIKKDKKIA